MSLGDPHIDISLEEQLSLILFHVLVLNHR